MANNDNYEYEMLDLYEIRDVNDAEDFFMEDWYEDYRNDDEFNELCEEVKRFLVDYDMWNNELQVKFNNAVGYDDWYD